MRKYLAEFLGTFILTFTACGATSFTGGYPGYLGVVGIALIFGLVMTALFSSIGSISGCHINPAVSLAMLISRRMNFIKFWNKWLWRTIRIFKYCCMGCFSC